MVARPGTRGPSYSRAWTVRCPVPWCRAAIDEPCCDQRGEVQTYPHTRRAALVADDATPMEALA